MAGPDAVNDQLPTGDGGYQPYKAAGKLAEKKALITGGDSGIGRAVAILYAMEGAESTIVYTPEEQKDAEDTRQLIEKKGGKVHLLQADLRKQQDCKEVVEKAQKAMGSINILVLNHGTQMMINDISELSELVVPLPNLSSGWTRRKHKKSTNMSTETNGSTHSQQTSTPSSSSPNTPSHK